MLLYQIYLFEARHREINENNMFTNKTMRSKSNENVA
jgi:hypothetical protein